MKSDSPLISILVAAWNEEACLTTFLEEYRKLNYPNKELVLCAGGTDDTFQIAVNWAAEDIIILEQKAGEGKFSALKQCFSASSGDIIVLTDADCIISSAHIKQLIEPLITHRLKAITGNFRPFDKKLSNGFVYCQWLQYVFPSVSTTCDISNRHILTGACSAIHRDLFEAAYNTNSTNLIGEDFYLTLYIQNLGHQIGLLPNCTIQTRFPETIKDYIIQRSRWRRTKWIYFLKMGLKDFKDVIVFLKELVVESINFLFVLVLILPLLFGLNGLLILLITWLAIFVYYLRKLNARNQFVLGHFSYTTSFSYTELYLNYFKLLYANSISILHTSISLLLPHLRNRW